MAGLSTHFLSKEDNSTLVQRVRDLLAHNIPQMDMKRVSERTVKEMSKAFNVSEAETDSSKGSLLFINGMNAIKVLKKRGEI